MIDRSNIIKEAIEYRDKLEKKVEELAQSVVRLQVSLDFADNTIKQKDREIAALEGYKDVNEDFKKAWEELKTENERIKRDFLKQNQWLQDQKKEIDELKTKNERLKEENKTLEQFLSKEPLALQALQKGYASYKKSTDVFYEMVKTYRQTLQEIKEIAEKPKPFKDFSEIKTTTEVEYDYATICNKLELRLHKVLELITKAESEEE